MNRTDEFVRRLRNAQITSDDLSLIRTALKREHDRLIEQKNDERLNEEQEALVAKVCDNLAVTRVRFDTVSTLLASYICTS
jgi:hypothetical protein